MEGQKNMDLLNLKNLNLWTKLWLKQITLLMVQRYEKDIVNLKAYFPSCRCVHKDSYMYVYESP